MKKMISLFVVTTFLVAAAATARAEGVSPAKSPLTMEQAKSRKIEELEQKMKLLQDDKTCVAAAKSKEELKKCRENAKAVLHKIQEEKKAKRAEMKVKREEAKAMKGK